MRTRPNVVFILADDMGHGDIACNGNDIVRTPQLDRLARAGLQLTQHYSASPLCAPARAALLTGRYNHRTGAVDVPSNRGLDRIALGETTIADCFSAAGYATGLVGKWHNGLHDLRYHPMNRGFRECIGFLNGGMDYYHWVLDRNGVSEESDGRYLTDVFTDEALGFIDRHRDEPFYLHLAYNAPHNPLQAPEELIRHYRDHGGLSDAVCRLYAMIEAMDTGIGRVLDRLAAHGLAEDTIVVFTSDNGPVLAGELARYNGPFSGAKGSVYEGGIRVPCLLRWPAGVAPGWRCDALTHFCDWLPTLTAACGVELPACLALDGYDRGTLLATGTDAVPELRFWQRNRYEPVACSNAAVRDGRWKLVWPTRAGSDRKLPEDNEAYYDGMAAAHRLMAIDPDLPERRIGPIDESRLYDLVSDPGETCDLADRHPQRVDQMRRRWLAWFDSVSSEWRTHRNADDSVPGAAAP